MKLIPLTSLKPKKGMQYVLFGINPYDGEWGSAGIYKMDGKSWRGVDRTWNHWCEFKAPKGEKEL